MKPIFHITTAAAAILALAFAGPAAAQYEGEIEIPDNVLDAIREFNEREPGTPNEVVVVLDPPATGEDGTATAEPAGEEEEIDDVVASILADEAAEAVEDPDAAEGVAATPGEPAPHGPEVRVQPLREPAGAKIDAADVKIHTPFAAKPLGRPTDGWKLVTSSEVPAFKKNVEVSPGTWLALSIRPHVLVPEADGQGVFQISEPGFDPASGYDQGATISASIASSIRQLEEDSLVLGKVIDDLEQILISLPRPASIDSNNNEDR